MRRSLCGFTLDSVVNQTCRPDLWIIVDDGSRDRTAEIVAPYAADHPWIRLVRRQRRGGRQLGPGVVNAFNAGLAALGDEPFDVIAKLDCDLEFGARNLRRHYGCTLTIPGWAWPAAPPYCCWKASSSPSVTPLTTCRARPNFTGGHVSGTSADFNAFTAGTSSTKPMPAATAGSPSATPGSSSFITACRAPVSGPAGTGHLGPGRLRHRQPPPLRPGPGHLSHGRTPLVGGGIGLHLGFFCQLLQSGPPAPHRSRPDPLPAAGAALPPHAWQPSAPQGDLTVTPAATVNILGVPVGVYTMDTLLARIEALIAAPGCAVAYGVNAHVHQSHLPSPRVFRRRCARPTCYTPTAPP